MVYEAKRNAERAEGVGHRETDIGVITQKKAGRIFPTAHPTFQEIFDDLQPKEFCEEHQLKLRNQEAFKQVRQLL